MIFITGDTHGDVQRFSSKNFYSFPEKEMTKEDYVIILGDFGLVWNSKEESQYERYWLNWLEEKPWTTLFIDGNHENYDRLDSYPIETWNGGLVQKIRPSVIHLMRGQVFEINNKTIFTMGGALSHDIKDGILEEGDPRIKEWNKDIFKLFRINHVSWWEREIPTSAEMIEGWKNLARVNNKVDFIFTHEVPYSIARQLALGGYIKKEDHNPLSLFLDEIKAKVDYQQWYTGHYHINEWFYYDKVGILFENIIQIA